VGTEHPLARLIDEIDLLGTYWNSKHGLFKQASPISGLIDEDTIQRILDTGLLRWPYFTLLKEGCQPGISEFTRTRNVMGQQVKGFADPRTVREHLAAGATMKLSQLEDWHLPIRTVMRQIEARLSAELKAYVFYTPCDNTGMLPHRDGSHVLAVQIVGAKEWRIYDSPGQIDSRPGLDVDVASHSHSFVMEPGDVLYLPHGYPHVATARGDTSLHLTLTITEPTPLDLVESLMSTFSDGAVNFLERDRQMTLEDKAETVTKALLDYLETVDARVLAEKAVRQMRERTV
jgi:ribosomal protein L16 Arg81 hydroxylase